MANYEGLVPDTFKSGAEVIVRGTLTADNQVAVIPDGIMAKCPSKYNADEQERQKQQKQGGDVAQQLKTLGVAQAFDGAEPAGAQRRV